MSKGLILISISISHGHTGPGQVSTVVHLGEEGDLPNHDYLKGRLCFWHSHSGFQEVKCMSSVCVILRCSPGEMVEAKTEEKFRLNLDNGRIKYVKARQSCTLQA